MYSKQPSTSKTHQKFRQAPENLKPVDALRSLIGKCVAVHCDKHAVVRGRLKGFTSGMHGPLGCLYIIDANKRPIIVRKWVMVVRGNLEGVEDYGETKFANCALMIEKELKE